MDEALLTDKASYFCIKIKFILTILKRKDAFLLRASSEMYLILVKHYLPQKIIQLGIV